jgi:glutathione peroxidase-family protein
MVRKTQDAGAAQDDLYSIPFQDARGRTRTLGEFRGEVLLIVNTASY